MSSSARILVLEDDSTLLELLCEALESSGYQVTGVDSPPLALELAQETSFDLVLSDIRMAGHLDGLGTVAALKQLRPGLRSIMMTGYAGDDGPRRAIELQVDDYLHKPFRVPGVLRAVKRVLSQPQNAGVLGGVAQTPLDPSNAGVLGGVAQTPLDPLNAGVLGGVAQSRLLHLFREEKYRLLKAFFLAWRSRWCSLQQALGCWEELERLEAEQLDSARLQAVGSCYRQLYLGLLEGRCPVPAGRVSVPGFQRCLDQLTSGEMSFSDMVALLRLRGQGQLADATGPWSELSRGLST